MKIQLYNTLTGRKDEFEPVEKDRVKMYVCGPTTYNYIHLGNARPLVVFDTLRRYLEYLGYEVFYVQNFTDIDDKVINRAREEGRDYRSIANRYIEEYFKDADALNVKRATLYPRVSQHIEDIIESVRRLIQGGYSYVVDGDVYFEVEKFHNYGRLSGRNLEDMRAGARVEISGVKRNPLDFALWKAAALGEPSWESPWGRGRPGWHIECSTMALKYLGPGFDIHGGGADLIFPHHENEIAQAEAQTGRPFARFWLHNGFITVNEEKMSKSKGNFFLVREILNQFRPQAVRLFLLSTHYRSPVDFDHEKLQAAEKGLERLENTHRMLREVLKGRNGVKNDWGSATGTALTERAEALRREFVAAMNDDFNTARSMAALYDLAREINSYLHKEADYDISALEVARAVFEELGDNVLGILNPGDDGERDDNLVAALMELIINIRQEARRRKDWVTADSIRESLGNMGIILEDTPHGPRWKKQGGP